MKVYIARDGTIVIEAETITEAYALNCVVKFDKDDKFSGESFRLDCSILIDKDNIQLHKKEA